MRNKPSALPAKLSPPRPQNAVARERLFDWIDAQQGRNGAIWIVGPPGAGKTTLVASYCQARKLRCLWYRLDADDNDLGRFFAFFGHAADAIGIKSQKAQRPIFEAEHLRQPLGFARVWFRSIFASLPRPLVVVLDNLEQAALPDLPGLLACVIDEIPQGVHLLITSRHAPPQALATARLNGALAVLAETELRFTAAEAANFAHAFGLDASAVAAAALRTQGWAAGLRLLSQNGNAGDSSAYAPLLFDYFEDLLRSGTDDAGRHMLFVAALLPWIPVALLVDLCEVADAALRLDELCSRNLFVEHVENSSDNYRLHPLLREFLRDRGLRYFETAERSALLTRAAHGFIAQGDHDAALDLSIDATDWDCTTALLHLVFEHKLALGQLDQLGGWVAHLPTSVIDDDPHLRYGLARLCFLREDNTALAHYEHACQTFAARGDLAGQLLCAAGVLEWSYNTDNFNDHRRWIALLRQDVEKKSPGAAPHELRALRLLNGRLLACFFDGDFDADAKQWADQVFALLVPGAAENERLSVAITLLGCLERHKRWDDAQLLAGRMEALLTSSRVSMRLKIITRQQIAIDLHRQTGDYTNLRDQALQARALARDYGFPALEFEAVAALLYASQYTGDDAETRKLLAELTGMIDPANVYHQRLGQQMWTWFELQLGHLSAAQEHADALRAAVVRSDMPARFRATWLQPAIYVQFTAGNRDSACAELGRLVDDAEPGSKQILQANLFALEASAHLDAGDLAAAERSLVLALSLAATSRYYGLLAPLRRLLSALCAFALERGAMPTFTRELIHRRRLRPTSTIAEQWPWPLRIRTLGQFSMAVDNVPLAFNGKVPKKPLALLKALIAHSSHAATDVSQDLLKDALWPEEDADAAHDAFNVALHRLRKLLPHGAELIRLRDGHLSLDGSLCWVDCFTFERYVYAVDEALANGVDATLISHRALSLYQGHFLREDRDELWSVSARERLRSKFNRMVIACGRALSAAGRESDALDCYRRGVETDDLAEAFYQGAMQSALMLNRPTDGLALYNRLERMLSLTLGVRPSLTSQALRRQLGEISR